MHAEHIAPAGADGVSGHIEEVWDVGANAREGALRWRRTDCGQ